MLLTSDVSCSGMVFTFLGKITVGGGVIHPILKSSVTFLLFPKMFARILCLQTFSDFCLYFPRRTNRAPSESYFNISCFVQHSVGARREQKASLKGLNARQEM